MSDIDVRMVHPYDLPEIWPVVRDRIADAAEYSNGRFTDKTVADRILQNLMQLWVIIENGEIITSFVTQVNTYPTGIKSCDIYAIGGHDTKKCVDAFTAAVSEWAESVGCSSLEFIGRPGWQKILKNWTRLSVMMELPLGGSNGRR